MSSHESCAEENPLVESTSTSKTTLIEKVVQWPVVLTRKRLIKKRPVGIHLGSRHRLIGKNSKLKLTFLRLASKIRKLRVEKKKLVKDFAAANRDLQMEADELRAQLELERWERAQEGAKYAQRVAMLQFQLNLRVAVAERMEQIGPLVTPNRTGSTLAS